MDEQLRTSDLNTAIIHLYRGEVSRANVWRNRLDVTTNWALIATGAAISFAFGEPDIHHSVIILNIVLITLFLVIESRRYRYYELWSYRIRLLEIYFYAMILDSHHLNLEWANHLVKSLRHPSFHISNLEAFGIRLRRNYIWIYSVLLATWFAKLMLYPEAINSWDELGVRARIGIIDGNWVSFVMILFHIGLLVLAVFTLRFQQTAGEIFSKDNDLFTA